MGSEWKKLDKAASDAWVVVGQYRNAPGRVWSSIQKGPEAANRFQAKMEAMGSIVRLCVPLLQTLDWLSGAGPFRPNSEESGTESWPPPNAQDDSGRYSQTSEACSGLSLSEQLEQTAEDQARNARQMSGVGMPRPMLELMWSLALDNMINAANVETQLGRMADLRLKAVELAMEWAHPVICHQALTKAMGFPMTPAQRATAGKMLVRIQESERTLSRG